MVDQRRSENYNYLKETFFKDGDVVDVCGGELTLSEDVLSFVGDISIGMHLEKIFEAEVPVQMPTVLYIEMLDGISFVFRR